VKNKKLVIVGASANSKLAKFYFQTDTEYDVVCFAVEKEFISHNVFDGLPVVPLETLPEQFPPSRYDVFVAVGYSEMNAVREKLYNTAKSFGYHLPNYISPRCSFLTRENIGDNNFILEDNTVQPFVKIGSNNVLWSGNHIGHDGEIGNHNFITSHVVVSGFVKIRNNCFIGVNATLRDAIEIADQTLIAAGAVIMADTEAKGVYVPPKSVKLNKDSTTIRIS
jgi:sugar O-acyltransferase (sialic acid O-acetyltransferase NeuD family)